MRLHLDICRLPGALWQGEGPALASAVRWRVDDPRAALAFLRGTIFCGFGFDTGRNWIARVLGFVSSQLRGADYRKFSTIPISTTSRMLDHYLCGTVLQLTLRWYVWNNLYRKIFKVLSFVNRFFEQHWNV